MQSERPYVPPITCRTESDRRSLQNDAADAGSCAPQWRRAADVAARACDRRTGVQAAAGGGRGLQGAASAGVKPPAVVAAKMPHCTCFQHCVCRTLLIRLVACDDHKRGWIPEKGRYCCKIAAADLRPVPVRHLRHRRASRQAAHQTSPPAGPPSWRPTSGRCSSGCGTCSSTRRRCP